MKSILLIGVGGTGSSAVDILYRKIEEFGNQTENRITAVVFDTDAGSVSSVTKAEAISMADPATVGTICDRIGKKFLREWFPCDKPSIRSQEMIRGASQWRKKSFLAFLNLMNKQECRQAFHRALDAAAISEPGASCEVYVIASIAGGTGSGSFIPISLYANRYIRDLGKEPIMNAMIACPDIYADSQIPENRVKIYANAYAILRELNAINLVANDYNSESNRTTEGQKKAPVKLRIGHPDEPTVGVLFDAEDPKYWTPDAAPFKQVYILDKIPGVHSIRAHEIVLANSLYSILCTDIGASFDSEASNHVSLHSQNNGSNAIYAGISTAQLCFPVDSVRNYLAHTKALAACEGEWLTLHRAVEERIHEDELRAKEMHRHFYMKDGDYARYFLSAYKAESDNRTGTVPSLVERCTMTEPDREGNRESIADHYYEALLSELASRIESERDAIKSMGSVKIVPKPKLFKSAEGKAAVSRNATAYRRHLERYFAGCVEAIRNATSGLAEAILTLDDRKDVRANARLSLVENLLVKNKHYIHPVAAMVQLCRIKLHISEFLDANGYDTWEELRTGDVRELPEGLTILDTKPAADKSAQPRKSFYYKWGNDRFTAFATRPEQYLHARTEPHSDSMFLAADAATILGRIHAEAETQIQIAVLSEVSRRLDLLIEKYRDFFNRFRSAKVDLAESAKMALRKDAGRADSVINIYSGEEQKERIAKEVFGNTGAESIEDVVAAEHTTGESVFRMAYSAAVGEQNDYDDTSRKAGNAFRKLFHDMVASYERTLSKSSAFRAFADMNVIEAIERSCGKGAEERTVHNAIRNTLIAAMEISKPALQIDDSEREDDTIMPSDITVVMMSYSTAEYIKTRSDFFGIRVSVSDGISEDTIVRSCAEEFVHRFTGNATAKVALVRHIPSQILYVTGEKMDITPLRIPKFDEMSSNPKYFKNYRQAVHNLEYYNTDMWNPHLGNNLHKRGFLPYMNPAMEKECDVKMVKAFFHGVQKGRIVYRESGRDRDVSFHYIDEVGEDRFILTASGSRVDMKNVAELFSWLRNEDSLIEQWSTSFDADIAEQKSNLPNVISEDDCGMLSGALSRSAFMKMIRSDLFTDTTKKNARGYGLFDFAYAVKASEESARDCDDADRILQVASDIFSDMCRFKTSRVSDFERVYNQQLEQLFLALAESRSIQSQRGPSRKAFFDRIAAWAYDLKAFRMIDKHKMMDAKNNINYVLFEPIPEILSVLKKEQGAPATAQEEKDSGESASAQGLSDEADEE